MKVTIAAFQMEIIPFDLHANLEKITKAAEKAAKRNTNFFVIPEKCWSGPFYVENRKNEVSDFVKEHASKIAKKYGFYFVAGSCHESRKELGEKPHNISYLFDPKGNCLGYYAKRHLFKGEKLGGLKSGNTHKVFETEFGRIGIQICRDVLYPEVSEVLGNMGAKIIFCPSFWSKFSTEYDESLIEKYHANDEVQTINYVVPTRSLENEAIFVFANAAGKYTTSNSDDTLLGYTQIVQPFTGPIEVYKHNKEMLMIHSIDTEIIEEARKTWKIRNN